MQIDFTKATTAEEKQTKEAEKEVKKEQTKEKKIEIANEKVICECGGTFTITNKASHYKTVKHIKNMKK